MMPRQVQTEGTDSTVLWLMSALLLWGLVMVYSTTIGLPDNPKFAKYTQLHFLNRHLLSLSIALLAAFIAYRIPIALWERAAPAIFVAALALLVLVLIPFIGKGVNGARRWIGLGFMNFQPSEFAKLAVLLYAANYMVRKMSLRENFIKAVWPMAVAVALTGSLLLAEPDMGAFMVIAVIAMGILFLGGVNARMFFLIALILVIAFACMVGFSEWRRERIFAYLDPWSEKHALGKGYQLSHSLIAVGRGEIFGVGLGGSLEKLHWLPEAHTDFMLAVIAEEFGLIGVLTVLVLFFMMVKKMVQIGRQAIAMDRVFAGLVAQGVAIWVGFQMFINVGVNLGALPTKGLTLPFMSYGGSAILMNLIAIAIVLRVDKENHDMKSGRSV
jgi:cell division protein FtsW